MWSLRTSGLVERSRRELDLGTNQRQGKEVRSLLSSRGRSRNYLNIRMSSDCYLAITIALTGVDIFGRRQTDDPPTIEERLSSIHCITTYTNSSTSLVSIGLTASVLRDEDLSPE